MAQSAKRSLCEPLIPRTHVKVENLTPQNVIVCAPSSYTQPSQRVFKVHIFFSFWLFKIGVFLCSPGYPATHFIVHAGPILLEILLALFFFFKFFMYVSGHPHWPEENVRPPEAGGEVVVSYPAWILGTKLRSSGSHL